jgi:hypothetical protein
MTTFKTIDVRSPDQFPVPTGGPKSKPLDLWFCPTATCGA